MPPRQSGRAFHEAYGTDERVNDAGIVVLAGGKTQCIVELVRVAANQLLRFSDAQQVEVANHRFADIGQVTQLAGFGSGASFHRRSIACDESDDSGFGAVQTLDEGIQMRAQFAEELIAVPVAQAVQQAQCHSQR